MRENGDMVAKPLVHRQTKPVHSFSTSTIRHSPPSIISALPKSSNLCLLVLANHRSAPRQFSPRRAGLPIEDSEYATANLPSYALCSTSHLLPAPTIASVSFPS